MEGNSFVVCHYICNVFLSPPKRNFCKVAFTSYNYTIIIQLIFLVTSKNNGTTVRENLGMFVKNNLLCLLHILTCVCTYTYILVSCINMHIRHTYIIMCVKILIFCLFHKTANNFKQQKSSVSVTLGDDQGTSHK